MVFANDCCNDSSRGNVVWVRRSGGSERVDWVGWLLRGSHASVTGGTVLREWSFQKLAL